MPTENAYLLSLCVAMRRRRSSDAWGPGGRLQLMRHLLCYGGLRAGSTAETFFAYRHFCIFIGATCVAWLAEKHQRTPGESPEILCQTLNPTAGYKRAWQHSQRPLPTHQAHGQHTHRGAVNKMSESAKEQFRKYLESAGAIDALVKGDFMVIGVCKFRTLGGSHSSLPWLCSAGDTV